MINDGSEYVIYIGTFMHVSFMLLTTVPSARIPNVPRYLQVHKSKKTHFCIIANLYNYSK